MEGVLDWVGGVCETVDCCVEGEGLFVEDGETVVECEKGEEELDTGPAVEVVSVFISVVVGIVDEGVVVDDGVTVVVEVPGDAVETKVDVEADDERLNVWDDVTGVVELTVGCV